MLEHDALRWAQAHHGRISAALRRAGSVDLSYFAACGGCRYRVRASLAFEWPHPAAQPAADKGFQPLTVVWKMEARKLIHALALIPSWLSGWDAGKLQPIGRERGASLDDFPLLRMTLKSEDFAAAVFPFAYLATRGELNDTLRRAGKAAWISEACNEGLQRLSIALVAALLIGSVRLDHAPPAGLQ